MIQVRSWDEIKAGDTLIYYDKTDEMAFDQRYYYIILSVSDNYYIQEARRFDGIYKGTANTRRKEDIEERIKNGHVFFKDKSNNKRSKYGFKPTPRRNV